MFCLEGTAVAAQVQRHQATMPHTEACLEEAYTLQNKPSFAAQAVVWPAITTSGATGVTIVAYRVL